MMTFIQRSGDRQTIDVRRRVVVVGIDLGTSGIKVAVRDATDTKRPITFIDFGTETEGYARFAVPSSIWVSGDRVLVGDAAEKAGTTGSGRVLRSAKLHLLRGLNRRASFAGAFGGPLPEHTLPPASEDEFALTYLLAVVIARTHDVLRAHDCGPDRAKLMYNMDVPVDQLGHDAVTMRFQRTLDVAVALAAGHPEPFTLRQALNAWWSVVERWPEEGVRPEDRVTDLIAEAHAVLAGIGDAIRLERRRSYAIIDIGAGTTDVGIFRRSDWDYEDRINFFSAATAQVGGDDLDRWIATEMPHAVRAHVAAQIRRIKPALAHGRSVEVLAGDEHHVVPADVFRVAASRLGSACRDHYIATWRNAYAKDPNQEEWREMSLLLVGGGALSPEVCARIQELPKDVKQTIRSQVVLGLDGGRPCDVWGATQTRPTVNEHLLLTAARGLTYSRVELQQFIKPADVSPLPPPARRGPASEVVQVRPRPDS